ncbi:MAG: hypothetical protein IIZ21_01840 [Firmicutes bacterium]|jgi:hypothetical protein|nr:hypothetical protein [Bacillota bacterium]MBQ1476004.1 hypothetical protein [Bacillota bacterium]MBQ2228321.1 hypothetical protein [Bacillota bacterium]MBQ4004538.1 hypothetical protein [Bacillota bacterium]MBR3396184.1 hypothetical protein [Bacillota bacterium]
MDRLLVGIETKLRAQEGMELVQVAILIAIAVFLGLIFKDKIGKFVNNVFGDLLKADF